MPIEEKKVLAFRVGVQHCPWTHGQGGANFYAAQFRCSGGQCFVEPIGLCQAKAVVDPVVGIDHSRRCLGIDLLGSFGVLTLLHGA